MALLFMDSFDHYVTADLLGKWTTASNATISAGTGRRGSASLHFNAGVSSSALRGVAAIGPTAILGFAWKGSTFLGGPTRVFGVFDGVINKDHVYAQIGVDGSIALFRGSAASNGTNQGGGTILGTTAGGVLAATITAYLELKIVIHDTAGIAILRVNGLDVLNLTGIDTSNGGAGVWSAVWWSNSGTTTGVDLDDLYVCDGNGSAPWNTFLGDVRVDARLPTGSGANSGFTASAGANFSCVDETTPNGDTDTVTAPTVGLTDTYALQDAPVPGSPILGVQHCINAKKLDAGNCAIAAVVRHGGADFVGTDLTPGVGYSYLLTPQAVNPGTGAIWQESDFNAAEFGYRKTL